MCERYRTLFVSFLLAGGLLASLGCMELDEPGYTGHDENALETELFDDENASSLAAPPQLWIAAYGYNAGGWVSESIYPRVLADVNGDGRQDIVGFGYDGTYVALSTGSSFGPAQLWIAGYGYNAGGWRTDMHPRVLADVNGDGREDIVGFGNAGTYVSLSTGSSFEPAQLWIANYGYDAGGWRVDLHPRVLADVNGDGRQDIVGFGYDGTFVSLSTGSSFEPAQLWIADYGYNTGGWRVDQHPRILADVNGDGRQDIVGFGNSGTYVSLSTGSSFAPTEFWVADYGYDAGNWRVDLHPRYLADVNGDGRQDIVGFGDAGVFVSLSTGSSFTPAAFWVANYGYSAGWRIDRHPRYLADVNGDGLQDIVGFGNAGAFVSLSTGSSFTPAQLWVANYGYDAGGWRVDLHPRVLADVNGDGLQDIVAFGYDGTFVSLMLP